MSYVLRSGLRLARAVVLAVVGAAAMVSLSSCSGEPSGEAAQQVAVDFVRAVAQRDGVRACSMLTTNAKSSVAGVTNVPCEEAILHVEENGARVDGVEVWGDSAQVEIGSDTIFLLLLDSGWRVNAAGCQAGPSDGPYDCGIKG